MPKLDITRGKAFDITGGIDDAGPGGARSYVNTNVILSQQELRVSRGQVPQPNNAGQL